MTSRVQEKVFIRPIRNCTNPYCKSFADALSGVGLKPIEFGTISRDIIVKRGWIVYHWPDEFFQNSTIFETIKSYTKMALLRISGNKIIWVAHNVWPHRRDIPPSAFLRRSFFRLLSGVIYLSHSSRREVITAHPELLTKDYVVVPHGVYNNVTSVKPSLPKVNSQSIKIALIGKVTRYKQPVLLASLVANHDEFELTLTIAGACDDKVIEKDLRDLASECPRINLQFRYHDDAELAEVVDKSDVVMMPYSEILNSGSALFSLSRWRPVVAPKLGSLEELAAEVGPEWIHLYDGDFSSQAFDAALRWSICVRNVPPNLDNQSWHIVGSRVAGFLKQIV